MSLARLILAHAVIAIVIGGSLVGRKMAGPWPFLCYDMFAGLKPEAIERLSLYGVAADGSEVLFCGVHLAPFTSDGVAEALGRLAGDRPRLEAALRDRLAAYDVERRAGRHDGPAIRAIRLYRVHWRLEQDARNVGAPDRRELLAEVGESR